MVYPEELFVKYITHVDTNKLLETGNFGNAYLGEELGLFPKRLS
jgi:hypothetical protein